MPSSKRRFLSGAIIATCVLFAALALHFALEWRKAIDNINAMIVTPVVLPPAQAAPPTQAEQNDNTATSADRSPSMADNPSSEDPAIATGIDAPAESGETLPITAPAADTVPTDVIVDDGTVNILLLGTDARPDEVAATRTDALVLVHINQQSERVSMLSLPRDLWVEYPGVGEGRINGAYPVGEHEYGSGGGAALAKATVEELLDLKIDYFILVNFEGFTTIIDQINGIRINVPDLIVDPNYPTERYGTTEIRFEPGWQRMNGERALMYARTRHADSDFGRNQRQQQVLMAVFERVRDQGMLQQLTSFDDYTAALRDYVRTDMSRNVMLQLATWARNLDVDQIRRYAIDASVIKPLEDPATFAADSRELRNLVSRMTGETSGPAGGE
jgi:LCP family protein required for cell wall assembly